MTDAPSLFPAAELRAFADRALRTVGLAPQLSQTVASILLEGDLMGHDTHGLALLPGYLSSAQAGGMALDGDATVVNERVATALWDGRLLPGPWLISEAFRVAVEKAESLGTYAITIRRSHHTAALIAYVAAVAERGMFAMLAVSDPTDACAAPFGGREPVLSTNPIAFGIPTCNGSVLVDISTSATTNGMVNRNARAGTDLPADWLVAPDGTPSHDPSVRFADPPGAIMPLGGVDNGHKGTGLGMTVEALTNGLADNGRLSAPQGWQSNVFVEVIDPEAFGGGMGFMAETGHLARLMRQSTPVDAGRPVRVPGDRALALKTDRLENGVPLSAPILAGLADWAAKLDLQLPATLG